MVPTRDLSSCFDCTSVRFQGFENNIKSLEGLCEGGQRKHLWLLPS